MPIITARFVLARARSASGILAIAKLTPSAIRSDCEAGSSGGGVAFFDRPMLLEVPFTLLHGSVAGRSRPPAFAFMRDEGTLAALARACGLARRQQWPPRSSADLWSASVARHRSLACSGRYRPPPGHANCNQTPAATPCDRARRSAADAGRAWSARCLPLRLALRSNVAAQSPPHPDDAGRPHGRHRPDRMPHRR